MAARKSCTHLTWAEAKSKVGGSSTSSKKPIPKKVDHASALTAKVIAKNSVSATDISKERTLLKRAKRDEERALAAAERRAEEKRREQAERIVKPFDLGKQRMIELADRLQKDTTYADCSEYDSGAAELQQLVEYIELQVNEVLGLEAIYNSHHDDGDDTTNKELRIDESARFEELQGLIEQWQMDPENESLCKEIVQHPPLSFTIQLVIDGAVDNDGNEKIDLVSLVLLRVSLPVLYPSEEHSFALPKFDIEYFLCTHREMEYPPDKPLESLAFLDEEGLRGTLNEAVQQLLPDPCVYMVITECLMMRLFEFVKLETKGKYLLDEFLLQKTNGDGS